MYIPRVQFRHRTWTNFVPKNTHIVQQQYMKYSSATKTGKVVHKSALADIPKEGQKMYLEYVQEIAKLRVLEVGDINFRSDHRIGNSTI